MFVVGGEADNAGIVSFQNDAVLEHDVAALGRVEGRELGDLLR